jgi:LCP family protein required for cell wall assembly
MAAGDDERPERPDYNVYRGRSGRGRKGKGRASEEKSEPRSDPGGDRDPDYSVYRSRRGPLAKLGGANLTALRERLRRGRRPEGGRPTERRPDDGLDWRRILRFALIGAGGWFLLSVVLFGISAQIQKGKLNSEAAELLGGNPFLAISPQTILVIGTDARPEATGAAEAETRQKCIKQGSSGQAPSSDCRGFRADTLMLVRAGGGSFAKLSIPRDTLAEIPGQGPAKINSAYATGGAALQIETVEQFLGIDIDHVVLLDFEGFADFIDAIGGVKVDNRTPLKSKVDGGSTQGGITLKLDVGEHTLDGQQALAFARTRKNERCDGEGKDRKTCDQPEDDLDRAQRQQQVLNGIKKQLTSPWRAPINFIRGPLIAWNAPKAMVTDMGAGTLPQLGFAMAIGGDSGTKILGKRNSTGTAAGNIVIPLERCEKAVQRFLGKAGPREPTCSPVAF